MSLTGLHTIPLALFSLPRACKVDLTGCALPTNEIEKYINTNDRPQISYSQNRQTNIDALIQTIYQKANKTHAIPDLGLLSQYDQEHGDYVLQWLSQFLTLNITQDEAERVAEIIGNSANATSGEFWREQFSGICKEGIRAVEKTKTLSLQNLGYYKISNQLDAPGNGDY